MYKIRLMKKAKVITRKEQKENVMVYLQLSVHFFKGAGLVLIPVIFVMTGIYIFFMNVELASVFNANSDESNANLTPLQK